MDDSLAVGVGQGVAQRHAIATMSRSESRPALEQLVERRAADKLGDEIGALVVVSASYSVTIRRVGEPGRRTGLALEPAR